jgi:hypothetical protein
MAPNLPCESSQPEKSQTCQARQAGSIKTMVIRCACVCYRVKIASNTTVMTTGQSGRKRGQDRFGKLPVGLGCAPKARFTL